MAVHSNRVAALRLLMTQTANRGRDEEMPRDHAASGRGSDRRARRLFQGLLSATVLLAALAIGFAATATAGHRNAECDGREANIVGTGGDDVLVGSGRNDVIHGRGGDDLIIGKGGDDRLCGGEGEDHFAGRGGRDRIRGGSDDDGLHGNRGADTLKGGPDDDRLNGGDGNDFCGGGKGIDVFVHCEDGNTTQRA